MAVPGDIVECDCGSLEILPANGKIIWHRRPGTQFNCPKSGVPAEHWDPVSRCPTCEVTSKLRNSKPGAKYPVYCAACGTAGNLGEFIDKRKLRHQVAPKPAAAAPRTKRYQDNPERRASLVKCPSCGGSRAEKSSKKAADLTCRDCGYTGSVANFVVREVAAVTTPAVAAAATGGSEVLFVPEKPISFRERAEERDFSEVLREQFAGRISEEAIETILAIAEREAKRAFVERKTMFAARSSAYAPMLDAFQDGWDRMAVMIAGQDEAVQDLAYLAYWGSLERECKRNGVAFKREDMAARGL